MFVQFLIILGMIVVAGPGHIEGGFEAIQEKGVKAALEQAWDEKDSSTLKGNYGND